MEYFSPSPPSKSTGTELAWDRARETRLIARTQWLAFAPVVITVLLGKISAPILPPRISVAWPCVLLVMMIGVVAGRFKLHIGRCVAFLAMFLWIGATQFARTIPFSPTSLAYLFGLYIPCLLVLKPDPIIDNTNEIALRKLSAFVGALSILGIAQYVVQFFIGERYAFPIEHFVPARWLVADFNFFIPLRFGSPIHKANGVFLVEPSFYSQIVALGLLLELSTSRRIPWMILFFVALACSYSGTGLVVLSVGLVSLVVLKRRWDVLGVIAGIAILAAALASVLDFAVFVQRSGEFSDPGSSGFQRFVAWIYLFGDQFWDHPERILFGTGVGTFQAFETVSRYESAEMAFSKAIFEFGLIGASLYFGFLAYAIWSTARPLSLKVGLATCVFMNGAYSDTVFGLLLGVMFWPPDPRNRESQPLGFGRQEPFNDGPYK